jgi:hypothetical protein
MKIVMRAVATDLGLPEPVLRQLFRENALRWVPGVVTAPGKSAR